MRVVYWSVVVTTDYAIMIYKENAIMTMVAAARVLEIKTNSWWKGSGNKKVRYHNHLPYKKKMENYAMELATLYVRTQK